MKQMVEEARCPWRLRYREGEEDVEEAEGVRFHCSGELVGGHGDAAAR
jgi:hypothetical protein